MGKRKTKKELAKQRKLQKERAVANRKREENIFYKITSFLMDALIDIFKGIVMLVSSLFIVGSKIVNIIAILVLLLLLMNIIYSVSNDDVNGMYVSIIGVVVLASVLFFIKRIDK
ncbi:hypothetical protein [Pseudogracilibacillus sp. SO30301A]|uniref:hypothetical protein n=1 Tax=Pseudogracilibacillus sp. SO30301A TaxID=3098291 RepID=UPI00300E01BF